MIYNNMAAARAALEANWRWPHFSIEELSCHCGGRFCDGAYFHAPEFLDALETLRERVSRALVITSGHRCAQWNAAVRGAPNSQHKRIAVDISLYGHDRRLLLNYAEALGFTGIGLARNFIHLDRRAIPARWFYNGSQSLWQT